MFLFIKYWLFSGLLSWSGPLAFRSQPVADFWNWAYDGRVAAGAQRWQRKFDRAVLADGAEHSRRLLSAASVFSARHHNRVQRSIKVRYAPAPWLGK